MLKKNKSVFVLSISLISILILASCSGTNGESGSSSSTSYGEVTEITTTTTIESSDSITPRQVASVSWSTSGIVETVEVEIGQEVTTGDILMTLEEDSVSDTILEAQRQLQEMTSSAAIAEAEQAVLDAQEAYDDAVYDLTYLDYVDDDVINTAYANYTIALEDYEDASDRYEALLDNDYDMDDPELAQAYLTLANAEEDMAYYLYVYNLYSNYSKSSDATYAEYENAVVLAQETLTEATYYLAAIQGEEIPSDYISTDISELYQLQESIDAVNLRATIDGIVGEINNEPGILVSSNSAAVEIVDRSTLSLTIQVDESDYLLITDVTDDLTGIVIVDVLPDEEFSAHVVSISQIGTVANNVVYFDVKLELDQADDSIPLYASASVEIEIGDPVTQLLVPVTAIQSDDDSEYVQVVKDGSLQRVDVVSGTIMSDDTVVVTGDLQAGDQVLLILDSTSSSDDDEEESSSLFGGLFGNLFGGGDTGGGNTQQGDGGGMDAGGGGMDAGGGGMDAGGGGMDAGGGGMDAGGGGMDAGGGGMQNP